MFYCAHFITAGSLLWAQVFSKTTKILNLSYSEKYQALWLPLPLNAHSTNQTIHHCSPAQVMQPVVFPLTPAAVRFPKSVKISSQPTKRVTCSSWTRADSWALFNERADGWTRPSVCAEESFPTLPFLSRVSVSVRLLPWGPPCDDTSPQWQQRTNFQTVAAILNHPEFNVPRHLINHPYRFFFKMSRYELQSRESGTRWSSPSIQSM